VKIHIEIRGKSRPVNCRRAQLPLGDGLDRRWASTHRPGGGPLWEQPLEDAPRHPDHTPGLADLDPELHRLPLGHSSERPRGKGEPCRLRRDSSKPSGRSEGTNALSKAAAALFVLFALAGCAPGAVGPGQTPNAPYQSATLATRVLGVRYLIRQRTFGP